MVRHNPYRLGTITSGALVSDPTNAVEPYDETRAFAIAVNGLATVNCELARKEPDAAEVGTILAFSGSAGESFPYDIPSTAAWVEEWVDLGYRVIQCRWQTGWLKETNDSNRGMAYCAARPATVVKYVWDTFCQSVDNLIVAGTSAGGSQAAYSVAFYGLGPKIAQLIFNGGPPHVDLVRACSAADPTYAMNQGQRQDIDNAWAFELAGGGPCDLQDSTVRVGDWAAQSILAGNLTFPTSLFLWGTSDTTVAPAQAELLATKLEANGIEISRSYIQGGAHDALTSAKGRQSARDMVEDRAFIRQSSGDATGTVTSLPISLSKPVKVGNLLVVAHRANAVSANMSGPSGFTLCNGDATNASVDSGTSGLKVYYKVATGGEESGLSVSATSSVIQGAHMFEVERQGITNWSVDKVDLTPGASVTSITCGPTNLPTANQEWCLAAINVNGAHGGIVTDFDNSYVQQSAVDGNRIITGAKAISSAATQQTSISWTTTRGAAAALVTFKSA